MIPRNRFREARRGFTLEEAQQLLDALNVWAEELDAGEPDPGWHTHLTDADGNELTIAIGPGEN